MNISRRLSIIGAAFALGVAPAMALAAGPPNHHKGPPSTVTAGKPSTTPPAQAEEYGKLCQNESKQHVVGQKGTPFSDCVTDLAQLANGQAKNPTSACKNESRQHVAGEKGTPFSACVSAAAKLLASQH